MYVVVYISNFLEVLCKQRLNPLFWLGAWMFAFNSHLLKYLTVNNKLFFKYSDFYVDSFKKKGSYMRKEESIYFHIHGWERKVPLSAHGRCFTTKKLSWT